MLELMEETTMSTVHSTTRATLVEGQRLDAATFFKRYEATPPATRAELIRGVVYMPSPVGRDHGKATVKVGAWLDHYEMRTPGVEVLDGATTMLDDLGVPEPDALLRILPEWGGQTRNWNSIIAGPPELVAEVSKATRYNDLGAKLDDYERAGVLEYLVRAFDPDEVIWQVRIEGRLTAVPPGPDGLYRSVTFPGLWLDPRALLANDSAGLIAALDRGLAAPEHAAFVAQLEAQCLRNAIPPGT
jgi:Uma2 family endonuclease